MNLLIYIPLTIILLLVINHNDIIIIIIIIRSRAPPCMSVCLSGSHHLRLASTAVFPPPACAASLCVCPYANLYVLCVSTSWTSTSTASSTSANCPFLTPKSSRALAPTAPHPPTHRAMPWYVILPPPRQYRQRMLQVRGSLRGLPVDVKCHTPPELTAADVQGWGLEAQMLSLLSHKNIVRFLGLCVSPPYIYLVFEPCERGSAIEALSELV
jgi:hypothetical protein